MLHLKLKGMEHRTICKFISIVSHTLDPWGGVKRPKHCLTESTYVIFQIKGNKTQSIMQAHILSLHMTPTTKVGQKSKFFWKVVMLHISLMRMEHRTPCKHIFCVTYIRRPLGGVKWSKYSFFLKIVILYIKSMRKGHRATCKYIFCPYTHPMPLRLDQKVKILFSESSHVAYQIKGNRA